MRSFLIFSIGLALLLVSITIYAFLYIDEFGKLISNEYWMFVDTSFTFKPIDIPPFMEHKSVFASYGIPVYPGIYKITIYNGSEAYIYDVDELYVVEGEFTLELVDYAYRVGVEVGEKTVGVHIERVDNWTIPILAILFIFGVMLVIGGYGWKRP